MKFCSECGGQLEDGVPAGDDRTRRVCRDCAHVHYQNPLVVVGCLVEVDRELLLCRRAIEPAHGRWTMPAGFLELGESVTAGARRETLEEAGAEVEITAPHAYLDLTHIGQLYALFRARLQRPGFAPGAESLECRLFAEGEIPWRELAFP
ncbi:MAG: NUDIX hydrolase, partial [Planctomycetes bacterium]|nr:NUDIX hydrolase [Planctomycetota bacterium]